MRRISFLALSVILLASSCIPNDEQPEAEAARDALYDIMKTYYLWNDKLPGVDVDNYPDPYKLMDALRYTTYDKWSFVADYDEFIADMSGSFVGHGFRAGLDENNNVRIVTVYSGSDLYFKGVRRGWIIKTINGTEVAPIFIANNSAAYSALIGKAEAGVTNTFVFEKPDATQVTITSPKASFTINTVLAYDTLHLKSGITGYLAFDAFLKVSPDELRNAFSYFKSCGTTDIIVDLRYNGGGYVDVAQLLSSYIAGNSYTTKTWIKVSYNSTVSNLENKTANFTTTSYPLNLTKAVFITTSGSASASEVVISSLKPYLDVKLVGSKTHGKPCGMDVIPYEFTYIFAPVTFEYKNAQDYGGFYDGIPVDVAAADDITRDFGDRKEASLAAAIAVLEGAVPPKSLPEEITSPVIFNENGPSNTNLYINNLNLSGK